MLGAISSTPVTATTSKSTKKVVQSLSKPSIIRLSQQTPSVVGATIREVDGPEVDAPQVDVPQVSARSAQEAFEALQGTSEVPSLAVKQTPKTKSKRPVKVLIEQNEN